MRTGYLGGSFDPVHTGHLVLAEACREGARLDRVVLIPAGTPPHKQGRPLAPADARLEMLSLATAGHPALSVDDRELSRNGPSYTVDTVREILSEAGPGDEVLWLIGGDTLPELPTWRDAAELLDLIPFVTAARPGYDVAPALRSLARELGEERTRRLADLVVPMPLIEVSSSDIRRRVAMGHSIRYLVPDAVRERILATGLYT